jgi:hypothetical protein
VGGNDDMDVAIFVVHVFVFSFSFIFGVCICRHNFDFSLFLLGIASGFPIHVSSKRIPNHAMAGT